MLFSSPKSFNEVIKPLIFLNCHSGIGTLRLLNYSKREYLCMQLHTGIVTVANWIAMYIALTVVAQAPNFRDASPMALVMYNALVYANCCYNVIGPCTIWLRRKGLRKCLQQMPILDKTFESVLGAKNNYRKDYICMVCGAIAIFLVMVALSSCDYAWSSAYSHSQWTFLCITMAFHHPILVMLVMDMNFCSCVRYLGKKFRDLNDALLRLAQTPDDSISHPDERLLKIYQNVQRKITQRHNRENTEVAENFWNDSRYLLREIQKAHLELCKLTRQVNSTFGIQNLISSGISFGIITGLLYTIYSASGWKRVTGNALDEIIPSVLWSALYAFKILVVNHFCWSVSSEAEKTREVIYEFLKMNLTDELQKDQIQLFAQQIFQNPIRFDACGFFTLDYTFIQGIIGSITTYLIILIQMSQLSEKTGADFSPLKNSTN